MQHREKCQDQDSGELTGKMSPVTRPGGRQLFLFPPGSGSGGSWIKLCWGCYNERGGEGDTQHGVLTFRTQVMSPPHGAINCSLICRPRRARICWN